MNPLINPRLIAGLLLAVGIIMILAEAHRSMVTQSPDWFRYLFGGSFIVSEIGRLRSKRAIH